MPAYRPAEERFWEKVNKTDTCWLWTGSSLFRGYGQLRVKGKLVLAHRFAYELTIGPIPLGLTLDHLCRTPACVHPQHLEPVTHAENVLRGVGPAAANARKTHCPQGHPYDLLNTYMRPSKTWRECRACHHARRT
jgi:hypothetical protein